MSDISFELAKKRFDVNIINKNMIEIMELKNNSNEREKYK